MERGRLSSEAVCLGGSDTEAERAVATQQKKEKERGTFTEEENKLTHKNEK